MRLASHIGEGRVVAAAAEVADGPSGLLFVVAPGMLQAVEIDAGGCLAFDNGLLPVVGPPEVHDILRVDPAGVIQRQDGGGGGDEHGNRAASLGGFGGAPELVAGDVRGQYQCFGTRIGGDRHGGQAQGRRGAVAGLLELHNAASRW